MTVSDYASSDHQLIVLAHDMANIFDETYMAQHGGAQVNMSSKRPIFITDVNEKLNDIIESKQRGRDKSPPFERQTILVE